MSRIIPIPVGPESDPARSKYVGSPLIINGFVEPSKQGKVPFAIYADPGLTSFTTFTNEGKIRGRFMLGGSLYVVAGETLYKVAPDGSKTVIGDVVGTMPVIVDRNAATIPEVIIVSDTIVYHLANDVLQVYPDNDLPSGVISVASLGHRMVFLLPSGVFFWSDVNNADSVVATNFKTAEARPDKGVRNITLGSEMWVLGEETTEVYGLSTDADDPFPRIQSGLILHGTKSKHSVCEADNSLTWVSHKAIVVRAEGFSAKRISNHAVEQDIQREINAQTADQIEAFTWTEGGHEFYQVSGSDWTWVYDYSSRLWHKKESQGKARSRIAQYIRAFDQHIVGDFESNILYHMRMDAYDENGEELILTVQTPIIDELGYYIIWDSLMLDMELGVGDQSVATTSPQFNPRVMLTWSDDGGNTFSAERERPLGEQSHWKGRVTFSLLGTSKEQGRMYRIRISAACKKVVIGAKARVRIMTAQSAAA